MKGPAEVVVVRPYAATDRQGFAQLVSTVLAEFGFAVDEVLEADLGDPSASYDAVWVAVDNDAVVGSVAVRHQDDGVVELKRMYLYPPYRGRGIGRSLLDAATSWARSEGSHSIVLDTSEAMSAAQRLYESAGFVRFGTRTETGARDSRCEVLYRLELSGRPSG